MVSLSPSPSTSTVLPGPSSGTQVQSHLLCSLRDPIIAKSTRGPDSELSTGFLDISRSPHTAVTLLPAVSHPLLNVLGTWRLTVRNHDLTLQLVVLLRMHDAATE